MVTADREAMTATVAAALAHHQTDPHGDLACNAHRAALIAVNALYPTTAAVWVAAELDTADGGRGWMRVTRDADTAKRLCEERYRDEAMRYHGVSHPPALAWHREHPLTSFGDETWTAHVHIPYSNSEFYDVRRIEVTP
jgi:hypothetical protein